MKYLIALDAGTTSVRAFCYEIATGKFVRGAQREVGSSYPQPGWVEQDAAEIERRAREVILECSSAVGAEEIAGIGIANQRETVVAWNAETGEPVCPAIVWQCRRTSDFCRSVGAAWTEVVLRKTGLLFDAYFSASKIKWIFDHVPAARRLADAGKLRVGTVDCFLVDRLTGGKVFRTDYTNASRTMLFNLGTLDWDDELLAFFGVPRSVLPEAVPSDSRFGETEIAGRKIPIAGVLGDQQAALLGQACLKEGEGKITYGTGLFLLVATGETPVRCPGGILTTVACSIGGKTTYALEGSAFHAGSSVQWLRDELGLIGTAAETEQIASEVEDTGGVVFVPAFTGLGAPYWAPKARGLLAGITRGTNRAHVVRAVLESIAYSARDLAAAMERGRGVRMRVARCDGGASANNFLMGFQADVLGIPVDRPVERESTALGAAFLCGVSLGEFGEEEIVRRRASERIFSPSPDRARFDALYEDYRRAVWRALADDKADF